MNGQERVKEINLILDKYYHGGEDAWEKLQKTHMALEIASHVDRKVNEYAERKEKRNGIKAKIKVIFESILIFTLIFPLIFRVMILILKGYQGNALTDINSIIFAIFITFIFTASASLIRMKNKELKKQQIIIKDDRQNYMKMVKHCHETINQVMMSSISGKVYCVFKFEEGKEIGLWRIFDSKEKVDFYINEVSSYVEHDIDTKFIWERWTVK